MHKTIFVCLLFSNLLVAKEFTKPPSLVMRTEISFVSHMTLDSKTHAEEDKWQLTFSLINNLHNKSEKQVVFSVSKKLAQSLALNVDYIVAYQTHNKTKVLGVKKYLPYNDGAKLIAVDGANPAVFRYNKMLVSQLQKYPKHAKANPQKFINNIINGMFENDPKIKEFFVRELIYWVDLHQYLSMKNFAQLSQVINAGSATEDMLTAFFGSRKSFHRSIGIKLLGTKAINLLTNYPINLDPFSNQSNLILKALAFTELYKLGSWDLYSRWLQSNIASITEKALFNLNKIDQRKTKELVKIRLLDTHISDSSRRVLMRYYLRHSIH